MLVNQYCNWNWNWLLCAPLMNIDRGFYCCCCFVLHCVLHSPLNFISLTIGALTSDNNSNNNDNDNNSFWAAVSRCVYNLIQLNLISMLIQLTIVQSAVSMSLIQRFNEPSEITVNRWVGKYHQPIYSIVGSPCWLMENRQNRLRSCLISAGSARV